MSEQFLKHIAANEYRNLQELVKKCMKFHKFLPITLIFGSSWVCHNFDNKYRNTSKTIVKSNIFGGIENAESIFSKLFSSFFEFSRLQINDEMIRYLLHGF